MRDWSLAFRPASYRGVSFWVEQDDPELASRRVAVHAISGGGNATEDLGELLSIIGVRAYLASDLADFEGKALEAACGREGKGFLVLPMDTGRQVYCTKCRRRRDKDKNGYIGYDLEFLPALDGKKPSASGVHAVGLSVAGAVSMIASTLARVF